MRTSTSLHNAIADEIGNIASVRDIRWTTIQIAKARIRRAVTALLTRNCAILRRVGFALLSDAGFVASTCHADFPVLAAVRVRYAREAFIALGIAAAIVR